MTKPAPLQSGDTIGVMSPSSWVEKKAVLKAKRWFEERGYKVLLHPQYEDRLGQSAGETQNKVKALHDLFQNQDVKAIICATGGNRASHMLDHLDYDLIRNNPKPLIGYSDVTGLHLALQSQCGLNTFYGPNFISFPLRPAEQTQFALDMMSGARKPEEFRYPMDHCRILKEGAAEGPLMGGLLHRFHILSPTRYMPKLEGAILFFEDLNEEYSRLDQQLLMLRQTGVFEKAAGIICGEFTNLSDSGRPYGFTFEELLLEHTDGYDIPIVIDAPFGHGDQLYTMPYGIKAGFTAQNGAVDLTLRESCVS